MAESVNPNERQRIVAEWAASLLMDAAFIAMAIFLFSAATKLNEVPTLSAAALEKPAKLETKENELVVVIDAAGLCKISGVAFTTEELHRQLIEAAKRNRDFPIVIKGGKNTAYDAVLKVIDLCKAAGLTNLKLRADEK